MTVAVKSTGESEVCKGAFFNDDSFTEISSDFKRFFFSFPNRIQGKNNGLTLPED